MPEDNPRHLPFEGLSLSRADFEGVWNVRRLIIDHLSGGVHRFRGTVTITESDFVEEGEVCHGSIAFRASRRYGLEDGASGVDVSFADGRAFVRLGMGAAQSVRHLCGADCYRGRFFFRSVNAWAEAWRVIGPRKRYRSLSFDSR